MLDNETRRICAVACDIEYINIVGFCTRSVSIVI